MQVLLTDKLYFNATGNDIIVSGWVEDYAYDRACKAARRWHDWLTQARIKGFFTLNFFPREAEMAPTDYEELFSESGDTLSFLPDGHPRMTSFIQHTKAAVSSIHFATQTHNPDWHALYERQLIHFIWKHLNA